MKNKYFFFDVPLLIYVLILSLAGIVFSYSSVILIEELNEKKYQITYLKQTLYFVSGVLLMWIASLFNYKKIASHGIFIYIICILILLYTLFFGKIVNNSKRWISFGLFSIQPSEFIKIAMIIIASNYLNKYRETIKEAKHIFIIIGIYLPPLLIIFLQPDLGTTMVYLIVFAMMLFMGGVNMKYFSGLAIITTLSILIPLGLTYIQMTQEQNTIVSNFLNNRYQIILIISFLITTIFLFGLSVWMRNLSIQNISLASLFILIGLVSALLVENVLLKEYQKERLIVFFNPQVSRWDLGYNIIQSQITIGSGGFFGKGLFQGTQGQLGYLPSRNTDFIFSVIGEEIGFIGSVFFVVIFYFFISRLFSIAKRSKDYLGSLIVFGIAAMFTTQTFINIGMTLGVAPVTGLPLPFLTYGGSTLWTSLIAIGIVFNVQLNRYVHK